MVYLLFPDETELFFMLLLYAEIYDYSHVAHFFKGGIGNVII
jgi:hypothetical protein